MKYHKRRRASKYTSKQLEEMPGKCQKLCRKLTDSETFIIMDYEKSFSFSVDNMPSNSGFWSGNKENALPEVIFKCKQKFTPRILVWLVISSKDISELHIETTKGSAINVDVYIGECLPKVLTFINKHHQGEKYIFWVDLATSHYANKTIEWLDEQNITFVPKAANSPNFQKARPIEDFWSILTNKVYKCGWEATDSQQIANRIRIKVKQVDLKVFQTTMNHIRSKLRKVENWTC